MKNNPLISVIVPIYNVENYIEECVISIKNQTYKNIEVLLIDDGSVDNSVDIASKLIINDDRFKIFNKKNGGLSDARNFGIDVSNGEYIVFIDSDDYVMDSFIYDLYNTLVKLNVEICVTSLKYKKDMNFKSIICDSQFCTVFSPFECIEKLYDNNNGYSLNFTVSHGKIFEKKLFKNIRFPFGKLHEDEYTTYKLYLAANKVGYLNKELYVYRVRKGSIVNSKYSLKNLDSIEAFEERINILKSKQYPLLSTYYAYMCLLSYHSFSLRKINEIKLSKIVKNKFNKNFFRVFLNVSLKRKIKLLILKFNDKVYHSKQNYFN